MFLIQPFEVDKAKILPCRVIKPFKKGTALIFSYFITLEIHGRACFVKQYRERPLPNTSRSRLAITITSSNSFIFGCNEILFILFRLKSFIGMFADSKPMLLITTKSAFPACEIFILN
jgi:hypothetical protein